MILVLSKIMLHFENNGQYSQYRKTNKQNECNCVCRKNVIHLQKKLISSNSANLGPGFISVVFFKSRLQTGQNPFSPAKAPSLAELCNPITRQAIELESYPNHPRIQHVL